MQDLILKLCKRGLVVHAAADGYFKIKISTFGNGKHFILPILMVYGVLSFAKRCRYKNL
jgi:hypothetical protein